MPDMFDLMDDQAIELDQQKEYVRTEIASDTTVECRQLANFGEMGIGLDFCGSCSRIKDLQVMQSPAGYYIGICDSDGPFCRATPYTNKKTAEYCGEVLKKRAESLNS